MNSDVVKPEKFGHLHLVYHFTIPLSHLREHKFKHGFHDTLNPICSCGNDIETSTRFLLHCPHYSN